MIDDESRSKFVGCPWQCLHYAAQSVVCVMKIARGDKPIGCTFDCNHYAAYAGMTAKIREQAEELLAMKEERRQEEKAAGTQET
jgi:hypothetical protein